MMTLYSMRSKIGVRYLAWILCAAMIFVGGVSTAFSAEICGPGDLADVPLELLGGSGPPPMFLIVMDNTVTMTYEMMTGGSDNGQLTNPDDPTAPIPYVFTTNTVGNNPNSVEYECPGAWKGLNYKYNKLFFNPDIDYDPWPRWVECANAPAGSIDQPSNVQPDPPDSTTNGAEALPDTPREDPMDNSYTFDLTAEFGSEDGFTGFEIGDVHTVVVDQEQNGDSFQLLASGLTFGSGTGKVSVKHTVTSANNSAGDEFYAGPVVFANTADNTDYVVVLATDAVLTTNAVWLSKQVSLSSAFATYFPSGETFDGFLADSIGEFSATWNVTGLDSNATYDVYTAWTDLDQRSDSVVYNIFRPTGISTDIKRRHFYLHSDINNGGDGFPYLVNLVDADTTVFYKLDETLGAVLDQVEDGELIETDYVDLPADLQAILPQPEDPDNNNALASWAAGYSYSDMLQNFANWFSFFRTRSMSARNAVGITINEMSYVMIGMMTIPPTRTRECRWVDAGFDGSHYDNSLDLMNFAYMIKDPGANPNFASTILDVGKYFEGASGSIPTNSTFITDLTTLQYVDANSYPYFTENYGGQCQHAFALIITDGGSTGSSNIVNYDSDNGYPFADGYDDTMADGAMHYYERDLQPNLSDDVPSNYMDQADWQHVVTYGITFGVDGQVRQSYPDCNALCESAADGCCPGSWQDPWTTNGNAAYEFSALDDLYHATVNSRGIYLYASNPQELVEQMRLIKSDIERRTGAAAAVTTNTFQRQIGSTLYQGLYDSSSWFGDILAKAVDPQTGAVGNTLWSAVDLLDAKIWSDRKIFTYAGGTAKDFSSAGGDIGLTANMINYLSGDRGNEGTLYRERVHVLGDIVHSEPFYHAGVLYVGANDGMMHAIDAGNGNELFAYIPSMVHSNLHNLSLNTFIDDHIYYVNASPHVEEVDGVSYLAGGLGKGGKGVYSLNVLDWDTTAPTAANVFNWEYTGAGDSDMGYVYGRAYVAKTSAGASVIFGNGYASDSGKAVLYVLNADTGAVIKKFDTSTVAGAGVVGCNGLSSPALIDTDIDGAIDLIYAGDLYGNLWKFDLQGASGSWTISYGGNPYFTAKDDAGNVQPITTQPDAMRHCITSRKGFIVVFGTGRYLNEDDLATNVADQVFYGLYDWENDWERAGKVATNKYLGTFGSGGTLSNTAATLLMQEKVADYSFGSTDYIITSDNPIVYFDPVTEIAGDHAGWYYKLPDSSERMVRKPSILNGIVYFITNTMNTQICSGTGASYLYALDACSGAAPSSPQFDLNGDNKVDEDDALDPTNPSGEHFDRTLFDPVAGPGILYINDTFGNIIEQPIPPDPPRMNYWILHE